MNTVYLNGDFVESESAMISVFDHGFLYGDGLFESLRSDAGVPFDFPHHFARLKRSAEILRIDIPYSETQLLEATATLMKKNNTGKKLYARITITRGQNGFDFSDSKAPTVLITTAPLNNYAPYRNGVRVITLPFRRLLPEVKSISLLPMVLAKQAIVDANAFEGIYTDEKGYFLEGSVSNVLLLRGKEIWIVPKKKALAGTAQKLFLKQHPDCAVVEKNFGRDDIQKTDRLFLTNSLFGWLPITMINEMKMEEVL